MNTGKSRMKKSLGKTDLKYAIKIISFLALFNGLFLTIFSQTKLTPHKIELKNGKTFTLNLPKEYEIIPAAENLGRIRFFAKSPDERIFVADMKDLSDNRNGKVFVLEDFDKNSGKFGKVTTYLENLRNPNSVSFHTDKFGRNWFYVAETDKLTRYRYEKHSDKPIGKPQIIVRFPDYGRSYKYGSWHLTRTIAFSPAGKIYVSIGSSCNSCVEKEKMRATVLEMNPDGGKMRYFVRGLRNAVGLKWIGDSLYATNMGVDHLGKDAPDETFYKLKENTDYGWSFCYQTNGRITFDEKYKLPNLPPPNCSVVPVSFAYFPAHSAALGFDYFDDKTSADYLKNSFLVALHGSTNRNDGRGYKVIILRENNKQEDFLTGFIDKKNIYGRPCDIMKLDADSFLLTDDYSGIVYYIRKKVSL